MSTSRATSFTNTTHQQWFSYRGSVYKFLTNHLSETSTKPSSARSHPLPEFSMPADSTSKPYCYNVYGALWFDTPEWYSLPCTQSATSNAAHLAQHYDRKHANQPIRHCISCKWFSVCSQDHGHKYIDAKPYPIRDSSLR